MATTDELVQKACLEIERAADYHRSSKMISAGMAFGVITSSGLVYSKGWGTTDVHAEPEKQQKVDGKHIFRIGSISKLFTDIAIMKLVEMGKLHLDVPVKQYIPTFNPKSNYNKEITLRMLMAHHSGLPREPPNGNYMDMSGPTLEATIQSLNSMHLVFEPGTKYKYSNAAIGLVGEILELVVGKKFFDHMQDLLNDLEMYNTSFRPLPHLIKNLCKGYMWTYEDPREQTAPMFELGEAPAGTMFSCVEDMAHFVEMLVNQGVYKGKRIVLQSTLEEMYREQYDDAPTGLGFVTRMREGLRMVGHGGAIYGYSAELVAVPELKLGFIGMLGLDATNAILGHLCAIGIHTILPIFRKGFVPSTKSILGIGPDIPIPDSIKESISGLWVLKPKLKANSDNNTLHTTSTEDPHTNPVVSVPTQESHLKWIYFFSTKNHVQVLYNHSRINVRVIPHEVPSHKIPPHHSVLRVTPDDRMLCGCEEQIYFDIFYDKQSHRIECITHNGVAYVRSPEVTYSPALSRRKTIHAAEDIEPLIGEYGPPHNPIFVYVREKQLIIQIEWFCYSVMEKIAPNVYNFEDDALYAYESITFERDPHNPAGPATAIILAGSIRMERVEPRKYSRLDSV